jgi:hypothetical protein
MIAARHSPRGLSVCGKCTAIAVALGVAVVTAGCESTQEKSKRLAQRGGAGFATKGLTVRKQSSDVRVLSTKALYDENGAAAVVAMRNVSRKPLAQVPVSIDVEGARGTSLFRNNQPGLEAALTRAPLLAPGRKFFWVNDQVVAASRPRSVEAKVGDAKPIDARRIPKITLTRPRLEDDPVSGVAAVGFAANRSKVEQRKLVIFAVATKGGTVVAAGRGQIRSVKPGKRARYQIFFIGNPRGATIDVAAPPTVLD